MSNKFLKGVELNEGKDQGYFIPNLTGTTDPTVKTEGMIGSQYMNTTTGYVYKCTAVSGSGDSIQYTWRILDDETKAIAYTKQALTEKQKTQARDNIGAASKPLLVEYDEQEGRTNYNAADIYNHVAAGGTVVLLYENNYFTLARATTRETESYAEFSYCGETDGAVYNIFVTSDGTLLRGTELATEKGIIDKLCPSFTENGSVVSCHPVEGYPLSVVSQIQPVQEGEGDPRPAQWVELTETNIKDFAGVIEQMYSDGEALIEGKTYRFVSNAKSSSGEIVPLATAEVWDAEGGYRLPIPCVVKDNYVEFTMFADDMDGEKTSSHVDIRLTYNGTVDDSTVYTESESSGEITLLPGVFVFQEYDPGNIRPITGHSEIKLWRGGKNLFDFVGLLGDESYSNTLHGVTAELKNGMVHLYGTNTHTTYVNPLASPRFSVGMYPIPAGTYTTPKVEYIYNGKKYPTGLTVQLHDTDIGKNTNYTGTFTTTKTLYLVQFYASVDYSGHTVDVEFPLMMVAGTAAPTTYEPYRGEDFTIGLGQTVYGGSYNWQTGELVIDRKMVTLDGSDDETWLAVDTNTDGKKRYVMNRKDTDILKDVCFPQGSSVIDSKLKCSILPTITTNSTYTCNNGIGSGNDILAVYIEQYATDPVGFKAAMTGAQIVFGLAEPITVQLPPWEVLALSGENIIYSDTGDTEVTGKTYPSTSSGGSADGAVLYTEQALTSTQKAQARTNIGAASDAEYQRFTQETTEEFSVTVKTVAQELGGVSKERARKNIDAAYIDDSNFGNDAWSSKNTVDKLCPAFSESGSTVTCTPVEGYPLQVVSYVEPVQEGEGDPRPNGPNLIVDTSYQENESKWYLDDYTQFYVFYIGGSFNNGQYRFSGSTDYEVMLVETNPDLYDWQVVKTFGGTFDEVVELTHLGDIDYGMIGLALAPNVIESSSLTAVIATLDGLRLEKGTGGNIRPITGHSEIKLTHGGRNLFNDVAFYKDNGFEMQADGTWSGKHTLKIIYENTSGYTGQIAISATGKRADPQTNTITFYIQYADGTNEYLTPFSTNTSITTSILTTRADKVVGSISWSYGNAGTYFIKDVQLEYGAVAHDYDAYKESVSIVADLDQAVYGGTYNWATGKLEITKVICILDSSCTIQEYQKDIEKNCSIFCIPIGDKAVGYGTSVCSHFHNTKDSTAYRVELAEVGMYTDHNTLSNIYLDWGSDDATTADFSAWLDEQKEAGTPVQLVYTLAEPIIEPIEAHAFHGLQGVNVLSVDTGFLTVTGRTDPGTIITSQQNAISRILERVAALEAAAVNNA